MSAATSHPPATPAVAVQAEPTNELDLWRKTRHEWRLEINRLEELLDSTNDPKRTGAFAAALAAHPKPAAPATADEQTARAFRDVCNEQLRNPGVNVMRRGAPATADEAVSDEAQSSYRKLCKHGQSRRCFDCERESK